MEGVKKTNVAMVRFQQQGAGFPLRNPYTMDVDRRENRNCYACREFEHLVRNCRNKEMGINKGMEVDQDTNSNLNGEGGLGSSN